MAKERRTEKVSTVLTPAQHAKLAAYAGRNHWSLSTALAVLVDAHAQEDEER